MNIKNVKRLFVGLVASSVIFLFSNCATKQLATLDTTLSSDKQCTLIIDGTLKVTSFNKKKVKWYSGFFGYGNSISSSSIKIPFGTNLFVVDYKKNVGGAGYYETKNIKVTYTFQAGKTYRMQSNGSHIYFTEE